MRPSASIPDARPESLVDVLLPNVHDEALWELANVTFLDDGEYVPVTPVDQLLMSFTRRLVTDPALGCVGVVQLPRARHRSALLLSICTHLLCRRRPVQHDGPVVLVGFDVDITSQLKALGVQHRRRMGLADGNPLSLHRLTRVGEIRPVVGHAVGNVNQSLVYFNTRIGCPDLTCNPPIVVLDATTVSHPTARRRALVWALAHGAVAIAVIGDTGDTGLIDFITELGSVPTVIAVNSTITANLVDTFGHGTEPTSTLSSMSVLVRSPSDVVLHAVGGPQINDTAGRAFASLVGRPSGPIPPQLDPHLALLRNGSRLAARTGDYRTACTYNPRAGEMPLLRLLDRDVHLPREWRNWETARLGTLKVAIRAMWRELDEDNPKLTGLWRLLDHLDRATTGNVLIRCHSSAAANATRTSLAGVDRSPAQEDLWRRIQHRIHFGMLKERFPAGSFEIQILTGAPPPWMFPHLLTIEAATTHVLTYDVEAAMLQRQGDRWAEAATKWEQAARQVLAAPPPPAAATSPVPPLSAPSTTNTASHFSVPGLSLSEILDLASHSIDPVDDTSAGTTTGHAGDRAHRCVPVNLTDGRTWWCVDEGDRSTPVLVVTAVGHDHRPVGELRPGDRIIVPAGEGTESIHVRLISASRSNADVRSLDLVLSQFRAAAKAVLASSPTIAAAIAETEAAGAVAPGQLQAWAKGTTIAPREPADVDAVFRAARRPCPDLGLIYAVAGRLRSLHRTLGRFVAAVTAGDHGSLDQLRDLVGPVADELLDEFVVAEVDSVGDGQLARAATAGRIR